MATLELYHAGSPKLRFGDSKAKTLGFPERFVAVFAEIGDGTFLVSQQSNKPTGRESKTNKPTGRESKISDIELTSES